MNISFILNPLSPAGLHHGHVKAIAEHVPQDRESPVKYLLFLSVN
jgi:hypothetical protein